MDRWSCPGLTICVVGGFLGVAPAHHGQLRVDALDWLHHFSCWRRWQRLGVFHIDRREKEQQEKHARVRRTHTPAGGFRGDFTPGTRGVQTSNSWLCDATPADKGAEGEETRVCFLHHEREDAYR